MEKVEISESTVEYLGIQFSRKGIAQVDSGKKLLFISKEQIRQIKLRDGTQAERPVFQVIVSIVVVLLGMLPLPHLISWFLTGGNAKDFEFLMLLLIPMGLWLAYEGVKQGLYFEIVMDHDTRKISFQKYPQEFLLKQMIEQAKKMGYVIDVSDGF